MDASLTLLTGRHDSAPVRELVASERHADIGYAETGAAASSIANASGTTSKLVMMLPPAPPAWAGA